MLSTENILISSRTYAGEDYYMTHTATVVIRATTVLPNGVPDDALRADFRGAIWHHVYGELKGPLDELVMLAKRSETDRQRATELEELLDKLLELK